MKCVLEEVSGNNCEEEELFNIAPAIEQSQRSGSTRENGDRSSIQYEPLAISVGGG